MKKFFIAILAFLYICTSAGATLHVHYCMGKLADSGLMKNNSKTCSKCGMEETGNGCCRHEEKFVKIDTDQKSTEPAFQLIQLISIVPHPFFEGTFSNNFPSVTVLNPINLASPPNSGVAVYICNRVFLI